MNKSTSTPPSRRQFIQASSALLALPWLESLAVAGEAPAPKRLVSVCTGFGLYGPSFFPETAGRDYQSSEYLKILDDLRDQFTVFSGISHPEIGGDHASEACFLTSAKHPTANTFRNTVSLDYVAAKHVGNATRFPLLSLRTMEGGGALSYTSTGAAIPAMDTPSKIFARMFLAGKAKDVEKEMARLKRGQSVLDHMGDRFAALKTKLSARDQQQVTDYTDAVRDMEKQLHADEAWVVRPKPTVSEPPPSDATDRADTVGRARLMFNLTKLALQTDSTRVVTIFIKGMDLKPPIEGVHEDHHGLSHHGRNPAKIEQLKIIEKLEMTAFRDFLLSLKNTKEGAGTLLDSTQVLIGSNLGDASGHGTSNLPILLAGGGYRHGQHIAGDRNDNTPLGKLFVSMLQRFGVETDKFGSGAGTMNGLA
ncbi:MAG TPA: DUF1552 domain-containing protein [Tepidisphaeraceae bacterium]|jgi:hypothetical protein|nr:DUF1552 domain-containing protein [Tepidisphaeraceae bacterium]